MVLALILLLMLILYRNGFITGNGMGSDIVIRISI
jgi:hypothetical protein